MHSLSPAWIRPLFFLLFAGLLASVSVYLYRRLIRDVTGHKVLRVVGAGLVVGLSLGALMLRVLRPRATFSQTFAVGLALWMGMLLYTVLSLWVLELVRVARARLAKEAAPPSPERRLFLSRALAATSVAAGGGLASFGVYRAYSPPGVTEFTVKLPGLPRTLDGYSIVQLSDVHIGPVLRQAFLDDLVERANALKPDLLAVTGDLVDGSVEDLGDIVGRMGRLRARHGTYFVSGNHDWYAGWDEWSQALSAMGLTVLRNRWLTIGDAGGSFDLIGLDDYGSRHVAQGYDFSAALAGRDPSRPSVVLSHQPGSFDDTVKEKLGLQLSGHSHGGQTFPSTGISSLIWGPRSAGYSREGDSQLVVSRGCGFVGPPMRLGSPPELVKVILTAG